MDRQQLALVLLPERPPVESGLPPALVVLAPVLVVLALSPVVLAQLLHRSAQLPRQTPPPDLVEPC